MKNSQHHNKKLSQLNDFCTIRFFHSFLAEWSPKKSFWVGLKWGNHRWINRKYRFGFLFNSFHCSLFFHLFYFSPNKNLLILIVNYCPMCIEKKTCWIKITIWNEMNWSLNWMSLKRIDNNADGQTWSYFLCFILNLI